jgi:hypothetical protein
LQKNNTQSDIYSFSNTKNRKRNHLYYYANFLTKKQLNYKQFKLLSAAILKIAAAYVEEISNKVLAFYSQKLDSFYVKPYITRFHKKYLKKKLKIFKKLAKRSCYFLGRHSFLTITVNPHNYDNFYDMCRTFISQSSKLINRINKKYKNLGYLKVVEFGPKHRLIHIHLLFFGIGYINPEWLTIQLDKLQLGKIKKIKEFKNSEDAFNYFYKYLMKSLKNENEINPNIALSWAINIKSFTMSFLLRRLLDEKNMTNLDKGSWTFEGIFQNIGIFGIVKGLRFYQLWFAG